MDLNLDNYNLTDTICAVATPLSRSALGVIKISGSRALEVGSKIFLPKRKKDIRKAKTFTLHYGWIVDGEISLFEEKSLNKNNLIVIDEVLLSIMRAPYSYTREDVVEISSHGGSAVINKILKIILSKGVRLALPGEFTWRAFIRGRIDLFQAEAISALVEAKTEKSLKYLGEQLKEGIKEDFSKLKTDIENVYLETEACLNFPDEIETINVEKVIPKINRVKEKIDKIIKSSQKGKLLSSGVKIVICGKTNVGKSTLFNDLVGKNRVIVSDISGTTRDVVGELIEIENLPCEIYDTAGFLNSDNPVEKEAVRKTQETIDAGEVFIFLVDASRELEDMDLEIYNKIKNKPHLVCLNKIDLPSGISNILQGFRESKILKISALKKEGLEQLKKEIKKIILDEDISFSDALFMGNYTYSCLIRISHLLSESLSFLNNNYSIDFLNLTLREILDEFSKIRGEPRHQEDILKNIFSRFCIGK